MSEPIHVPFPEIGQFRQTVRAVCERATFVRKDELTGKAVYDPTAKRPTLAFEGTVKIHGTNASLVTDYKLRNDPPGESDDAQTDAWLQTRETILGPGKDNCGFADAVFKRGLWSLFHFVPHLDTDVVAIFGEWAGQSVQGGTAIAQLPKTFLIFAVKVGDRWMSRKEIETAIPNLPEMGVYNLASLVLPYYLEIDFEHPEEAQNKLAFLTERVEGRCPVAGKLGVEGIGEGIVWRCVTPGWEDPRFWFKVKGEKHSATKVKTLAAVDIEAVRTANEFVDKVVTDARCQQSIAKLREAGLPLDRTSLGEFLRWIFNDVAKEESDTAAASGVDIKKMGGAISLKAKRWFFENEKDFPI